MMKKLLLSILIAFGALFSINAQSYALQLSNNEMNCYFDMYKNGTYLIKLSYKGASDLMMSQIFSFGDYKMDENGDYRLTDKTHGFDIVLEPISDKKVFLVKNGFGWMQMNYLVKTGEKTTTPISVLDSFLSKDEVVSFRKKLISGFVSQENRIKYALYRSEQNPDFSLNLKEDGTYAVKYYSLELSAGNWTKEGNQLLLKDKNLNSNFYLIIDKDNLLRSTLLPGDFFLSKFR